MQEWVIVRFPSTRSVFADGNRLGDTNRLLTVSRGRHTFDLGAPVDYTPARHTVDVTGTTAENPLEITFTRTRAVGTPDE